MFLWRTPRISSDKILGPVFVICAKFTDDQILTVSKIWKKNHKKWKNADGATCWQKLTEHLMINIYAKNHDDQCISC